MTDGKLIGGLTRRQFLTKIMPACSMACLSSGSIWASSLSGNSTFFQEAKHKFEKEYRRKMTYKDFWYQQWNEFVTLAKALEKEMGKDKLIEFLKKTTTEQWIKQGQAQAKRSPDNSFKTYVDTFRPPRFEDILTHEVVVDTDTVFELKVTECISQGYFNWAKASDIGYAWICFGDYAWAEGFNPKIKLIRDKTLMQGHKFCNHRYVWKG